MHVCRSELLPGVSQTHDHDLELKKTNEPWLFWHKRIANNTIKSKARAVTAEMLVEDKTLHTMRVRTDQITQYTVAFFREW